MCRSTLLSVLSAALLLLGVATCVEAVCTATAGHYSVDMAEFHADAYVSSSVPQTFYIVVQDIALHTRSTFGSPLCSSTSATDVTGVLQGKAWVSSFTWNLASKQLTVVTLGGTNVGTLVKVDNTQVVDWLSLTPNNDPPGASITEATYDATCGAQILYVNQFISVSGPENPGSYFLTLLNNGQLVIQEGVDPAHAGAFVWRSTTNIVEPSNFYYARGGYDGHLNVFAGRWLGSLTDNVVNYFGPDRTPRTFIAPYMRFTWSGIFGQNPVLELIDSDSEQCNVQLWDSTQALNLKQGIEGLPVGICSSTGMDCTITLNYYPDGTASGVDGCHSDFGFDMTVNRSSDATLWSFKGESPKYAPTGLRYYTFPTTSAGSMNLLRYDDNDNVLQTTIVC